MLTTQKSQAIAIRPVSPKVAAEERFKQERMHDVKVMLQDLFEREESTIRLVLDSLYDVGVINIINKKIKFSPLNSFLKSLAKLPKPVAKVLMWRWFKKNCAELLVNWLYRKVSF
jgi:hypothetical protein